jgi:aspartate-semialdehyde dehydrogenase
MIVAIVGATGMVGQEMRRILYDRSFPAREFLMVGSENSIGKKIDFGEQQLTVISIQHALNRKPDIALFSAGGDVSLEWAPKFAAAGATVIDNSSAWRMDPSVKLIVPEVNGHLLTKDDRIIANPNCSTIQLVMVLEPLHRRYGIRRVIVSTYQSITGTGYKAVEQMEAERKGEESVKVYPYQIDLNLIPQCDVFLDNDYTKEEMKLTHETVKIMGDSSVRVSATAVRVPVTGGHSESVNIEFEEIPDVSEIRQILTSSAGLEVLDSPSDKVYPMPFYSKNKDEVFVGRIRLDHSNPKAVNLFIVADNLRKGAATNAVQIAESMIRLMK